MIVKRTRIYDKLVKSKREFSRWLEKVFDMPGARFFSMFLAVLMICQELAKTYSVGYRTSYDAINYKLYLTG